MRKDSSLAAVISNRYWTESLAERVVAAWRRSGLSASAFARKYGVHEKRLLRWRRRVSEPVVSRFHPVQVERSSAPVAAPIEVVLAGGERLVVREGFDPILLRQVLETLESRGC